jgi:hypothetical protein
MDSNGDGVLVTSSLCLLPIAPEPQIGIVQWPETGFFYFSRLTRMEKSASDLLYHAVPDETIRAGMEVTR